MEDANIYTPPKSDLGETEVQLVNIAESNLASRWARLGAWIIDGVVLVLVTFSLMYVTGYWGKAIESTLSIYETLYLSLFGLLDYLVLNGYLLAKRGQTIGKWALGIKIISPKNGAILPLWKVFSARHLPQVIVSMIPIIGGLLLIVEWFFIFRDDKRCLHDLIAGTIVIKEYAH